MSSNTSKGLGKKGSKLWMGLVVNVGCLRREIEDLILGDAHSLQKDYIATSNAGNRLHWICPLQEEDFSEYELKQLDTEKIFGMNTQAAREFFEFWPQRQPQWDGLATSLDGEILYLIEAKSHESEMSTKFSGAKRSQDIETEQAEKNRILIEDSIQEAQKELFNQEDNSLWTDGFYQLGNRLTFLYFLQKGIKEGKISKIKNVKLVMLNFADDFTMTQQPTIDAWEKHYKRVWERMTGNMKTPEEVDVLIRHYSVKGESIQF